MNRHSLRLSSLTLFVTGIAAFVFLLAGCGGGGGSSTRQTGTGPVQTGTQTEQSGWTLTNGTPSYVQAKKKWTILVYLNAANDLEEYGPLNVNQMEQIGSDPTNLNIVVQFKRIKGQYSTIDGDWGGTRRYYVTKDSDTTNTHSTLLSSRDGLNMGSAQTLQDFVQWGIKTYPADHYCLVVWNHGAGWRSAKVPTSNRVSSHGQTGRGVSYDDEFMVNGYSSHIDTIDLPAAIDMGSGRKWDLLTFDSSLMQMAEVSYEVRDKASYIVGSEESPPGEGYPYDLVLDDLTANPSMDGKALGRIFAQEMLNAYGASSDITESVLDTSKLAAIAPAVDSLGSALYAAKGTYGAAISNARSGADEYAYAENHDLLDFTRRLARNDSDTGLTVTNDAGVNAAVNQVNSAVNAAILFNVHGNAHANSNGLAILLATPYQYRNIDQEQADGFGNRYGTLAFAKAAPNWQNFLANGPQ